MTQDFINLSIDGIDLSFDERDEFNRKPIAQNIINLLSSEIDLSPMVIDGDWGIGKTEFCMKLKNEYKNQFKDDKVIYIDAFREDYADNPFLTILTAIMRGLPKSKKPALTKVGIPILKAITMGAIKGLINNFTMQLNSGVGEEIANELSAATKDAASQFIENQLSQHESLEANIMALREALMSMTTDFKVIIFIDELDRCRPDFAVSILEFIKHIFSTRNVKFVLVTNTSQLRAAINHRYGQNVDANRYLEKFIKFSFMLPNTIPKKNDEYNSASYEYFRLLVNTDKSMSEEVKENLASINFDNISDNIIPYLIKSHNLSLRQVEKFFTYIQIYINVSQDVNGGSLVSDNRNFELTIFGIFIYCFDTDLTNAFLKQSVDTKTISKFFSLTQDDFAKENIENMMVFVTAIIILGCQLNENENEFDFDKNIQFKQLLDHEFSKFKNRPQFIHQTIVRVIHKLQLVR